MCLLGRIVALVATFAGLGALLGLVPGYHFHSDVVLGALFGLVAVGITATFAGIAALTKPRKTLRTFALVVVSVSGTVVAAALLWWYAVGPENIYAFNPLIDTKLEPSDVLERLEEIHIGMSRSDAERLLGRPAFDGLYSRDGKCISCDHAWLRVRVSYRDERVSAIEHTWEMD